MENIKQYFDEVYDKTYNDILKYVISKTDNLSYVEDIIQNVYINFYKTLIKKGFNYLDSNKAYLIKLSKSELFKYYSLKNKVKFIFNINDKEDLNILENVPDKINIEDFVLDEISVEEIWEFIKKEDLVTQKIMALYFQNNMKIKEIAEYLNISESNVKNRLYRTIEKLKRLFGGEIDE